MIPAHHRRPDDRREAPAPSCRCSCSAPRSAPRPPRCGRACAAPPHRRLRRARLGPARPRPQHGGARRAVHDGRARGRRARRGRRRAGRARRARRLLLVRRRLGRRRGRPAAAARRARPGRDAVLLCTGARIGDEAHVGRPDRPGQRVRHAGHGVRPRPSAGSGPASSTGTPRSARALLHALQRQPTTRATCQVCGALADFDVRDRLAEIAAPVLAVAGAHDVVAPAATCSRRSPTAYSDGRLVELDGRRPPRAGRGARRPSPGLIREHCLGEEPSRRPTSDVTTPAWRSAARCSATTHVDRATAGHHRLHPRLPGADHHVRLGQRSGPVPASTAAAAR